MKVVQCERRGHIMNAWRVGSSVNNCAFRSVTDINCPCKYYKQYLPPKLIFCGAFYPDEGNVFLFFDGEYFILNL